MMKIGACVFAAYSTAKITRMSEASLRKAVGDGKTTKLGGGGLAGLERNGCVFPAGVDDRVQDIGGIAGSEEERTNDDILALEVDVFGVSARLDEHGVSGAGNVNTRLDGGRDIWKIAGNADGAGES